MVRFRTLLEFLVWKYAEVYTSTERVGAIGLDEAIIDIENDRVKNRADEHFRITKGDPVRLEWLTRTTVERYHEYYATFIRAEERKQPQESNAEPID